MAGGSGGGATSHACRYGRDQRTLHDHGFGSLDGGCLAAIKPHTDRAVQYVDLRFCSVHFNVVDPLATTTRGSAAGEALADGYPEYYSNPRHVLSGASRAGGVRH